MIYSSTYTIRHPRLKPYIQYILFNHAEESGQSATSFSNDNICLGILNGSEFVKSDDGSFTNRHKSEISSYISGMYLKPHHFSSNARLDEICIDFTPVGFYQFFDFPAHQYIIGEDMITEAFGTKAHAFFQGIFQKTSITARGLAIEQFLLHRLKNKKVAFLAQAIHSLKSKHQHSLSAISRELNCSSRKLQRVFKATLDITPKQYQRIIRFRKSLALIQMKEAEQLLTQIAYRGGYNDQSHFIKEIKGFTGRSPGQLKQSLHNIDGKVIVSV